MANKYANLIGTNLIKDEYTKINTGFDAVETDINTVTTDIANHGTAADPHDQYALDTDLATLESALEGHELDDTAHGIGAIAQAVDNLEQEVSSHMADNVSQNPHGITAIANKNYDRGTWTPIIADGAGFTTDYVTQYGRFQRIDDVFYINGYIKASVTHTGQTSLTLRVSGLPAVPRDGSFDALSGFVSRFTAEGYTQVVAKHDGTRFLLDIEFYLIGSGKTVEHLAIGELPSGEVIEIYLEGSFRV